MKRLIKPKETFSIGLDIGTQTVKAVKLKFFEETVELCGFALEPSQLDSNEVLKKLKESQGQDVTIGVGGPSTVIRHISFPKMNEDELRQALKFEAQKHIPFSIEEVNLDGYILKEDLQDNKMLVLIAAVKNELLNQRLKMIEDAGFRVNIVDLDSIALANAFNFNYSQDDNLKQKAIALLNIGASISSLDILENGLLRLSRDIHISGNNFTHRLMDILALDFRAAEGMKLNPDSQNAQKMQLALEPVFTNLADTIRTSFDYYETQNTSSVTKIFLSGGASSLVGLRDILAKLLAVEVEYWDPLKRINLSSDIDSQKVKALSVQLAVAVGLALRQ